MKRDKKNAREILDRALIHHGNLSQDDVNTAIDRAWESLQSDMSSATELKIPSLRPARRSVFGVRFAAVAAVLLIAFVSFVIMRDRPSSPDAVVGVGDVVRSTGKDNRIVFLADGSQIEMRPQTEFNVERADDGIRVRLSKGSVIVHAARQRSGHLYVQTKDMTVSVVGTVFLVNAEEEGSRVAVIEGEVRVQQGSETTNLVRGQQLATSSTMPSRTVVEEVAWSQSAETHVAVLQQTSAPPATLRKRLEFEVASIRPIGYEEGMNILGPMSAPDHFFGDENEIRCRGIDGGWSSQQDRNIVANASNVPLGRCVGVAGVTYFARIVRQLDHPSVTGRDYTRIPRELVQTNYLLTAKAEDPSKATKADLKEMLKSFALDRLKLQYHLETTMVDGWAVRIAPGGLKMKEIPLDTLDQERATTKRRTTIQAFFSGMAPLNGQLISHGPVIDMTGLTGKAFEFTWDPKIIPPLPGGGGRGGGSMTVGGANVPVPDYDPPLEKQLEEQLGLTIKKEKVPVQTLVVDHLEKPSEN